MRRHLVAILAVALLVSTGAIAQVDKAAMDADSPPDFSNDFQVAAAAPAADQCLEDFDNGVPPADWTVTDLAGFGVVWNTNTFCLEPNKVGTGESACVDSDEAGNYTYDTELISPSYDFSGATNAGMTAPLFYNDLIGGAGYDFFEIDYSTDGGSNWVNLLAWDEDHDETVSLDLSAADGAADVKIRFHYYDLRDGAWDWDVQVDDFVLTADGTITGPNCGGGDGGGDGGGTVPATSTTGLIILAVLLMIGGSLFVMRRRKA